MIHHLYIGGAGWRWGGAFGAIERNSFWWKATQSFVKVYSNIRIFSRYSLCIELSKSHPQFCPYLNFAFFWVFWDFLLCLSSFSAILLGTWQPKKSHNTRRSPLHPYTLSLMCCVYTHIMSLVCCSYNAYRIRLLF